MSAMPIGMPGWPELAACTASMARKRMALARSRRLGVVMGRWDHGWRPASRGRGIVPCPCGEAKTPASCGPAQGRLETACKKGTASEAADLLLILSGKAKVESKPP